MNDVKSQGTRQERLPDDLVWDDGHATDLALAAMADGEESLLPASLEAHVHACPSCTQRFGETALLSMGTSRAIRELGPLLRITPVPVAPEVAERASARAAARRKPRMPMPMFAAALVLAALGATPTLIQLPGRFAELCFALLHTVPTLSRSGAQLLRSGLGPAWVAVTLVCAAILVMMSVALTRLLPRPVSS
jgi:hypothetical protein